MHGLKQLCSNKREGLGTMKMQEIENKGSWILSHVLLYETDWGESWCVVLMMLNFKSLQHFLNNSPLDICEWGLDFSVAGIQSWNLGSNTGVLIRIMEIDEGSWGWHGAFWGAWFCSSGMPTLLLWDIKKITGKKMRR